MPSRPYNGLVIDAHHHLWRYSADEYDWINDRMDLLRRDFSVADLASDIASAGVDHTIAVQARPVQSKRSSRTSTILLPASISA